MGNTRDLSNRINESYSRLSKGQKLLATYITDNYDKAVFLTAARLGEVVGVSESTVVRFATHLGYQRVSGIPECIGRTCEKQAEFDPAYGSDLWKNQSVENIGIRSCTRMRTRSIPRWSKSIRNAFEIAVNTILNAKHIYIIGIRSCAPLASFMAFYFNLMFDNVHLLQTSSSSETF